MAAAAASDLSPVDDGFGCNGKDSPVVTMMNKRLRALKKKFNRIVQIEESRDQGKPINKEQEEVLKTKVQVSALIEEYERLRQPLVASLKEEIALKQKEWLQEQQQQQQEDEGGAKEEEAVASNGSSEGTPETDRLPNGHHDDVEDSRKQEQEPEEQQEQEQEPEEQQEPAQQQQLEEQQLADLIQMLYFALLFDIKSQGDLQHLMWTRYHERSSCISYDYVTDDPTPPLVDADLGLLAKFGSLVVSRPPNATISHKEALEVCVAHARRWLRNSEERIDDDLNISYAFVRERLNRITSSDYLTMTPELKTVTPELQTVTQHLNKTAEPAAVSRTDSQEHQEVPADESALDDAPGKVEASQKEANNPVVANPSSASDDSAEQAPHENGNGQFEPPQGHQGQQQRRGGRGYQGPRGGGRGAYGGRGGGNRGGYPGSGRGVRGNRVSYQNGRGGGYQNGRGGVGQYYEQHGGGGYFQQRPYYGGGGGRRGGAAAHANGPPATATTTAAQS